MHHPTDRIAHTTAFVTPVVEHWLEWEIALNKQIPPFIEYIEYMKRGVWIGELQYKNNKNK